MRNPIEWFFGPYGASREELQRLQTMRLDARDMTRRLRNSYLPPYRAAWGKPAGIRDLIDRTNAEIVAERTRLGLHPETGRTLDKPVIRRRRVQWSEAEQRLVPVKVMDLREEGG